MRGALSRSAPILAACIAIGGCIPFGSYQSARLPEPGQREICIAASRNNFRTNDDDPSGETLLEIMFRGSWNPRVGGGARASLVFLDEGITMGVFGVDLKIPIVPNFLALDPQASISTYSFTTLSPALIASLPLGSRVGLDLSGRYFLYRGQDTAVYAMTAGLAIESQARGPIWRPELAVMHSEDREWAFQGGLGFQFHGAAPP